MKRKIELMVAAMSFKQTCEDMGYTDDEFYEITKNMFVSSVSCKASKQKVPIQFVQDEFFNAELEAMRVLEKDKK